MAKAYLSDRAAAYSASRPEVRAESEAPCESEMPSPAAQSGPAAGGPGERDGENVESVVAPSGSSLSAPARGNSLPDHYQVVVHVDEGALRGGAGRAELPIETVKRIVCDGGLIPLVEDEAGMPLALGRKRRVVSPALRRLLWARDRGCTFPGCHRRHYAEAHHLRHWANGGKTEPGNLTLLCSFHHRLLHEGGFRVRLGRDGRLEYLRADGRVIPRSGYRREDMVNEVEMQCKAEDSISIPWTPSSETPAVHCSG
ncbi:MAG TPA: DUF222 domain-containing protein [Gammaproteobacteria bacterium]|nr:DUF222 domain-containing protein [Gammaproteobacteria bacterium]